MENHVYTRVQISRCFIYHILSIHRTLHNVFLKLVDIDTLQFHWGSKLVTTLWTSVPCWYGVSFVTGVATLLMVILWWNKNDNVSKTGKPAVDFMNSRIDPTLS